MILRKWIVFVGLSGSGKTFYGRKLAHLIHKQFFDLDQEIENALNMRILDVFARKGEEYFRACEQKAFFDTITNNKPSILSLGGGAFVNKDIRSYALQHCIVIELNRPLHQIYKLLKQNHQRPLLKNQNLKHQLKQMLASRKEFYNASHLALCCNSKKSTTKQLKSVVKLLVVKGIIQMQQ